jgi:hypothetical protein
MRKIGVMVLMFGIVLGAGAFAQNVDIPNTFGIGLSVGGMGGGDFASCVDLTSPYLHLWGNEYIAFRLAGDMMAKEGVPIGSTTNTLT